MLVVQLCPTLGILEIWLTQRIVLFVRSEKAWTCFLGCDILWFTKNTCLKTLSNPSFQTSALESKLKMLVLKLCNISALGQKS